MFIHHIWMSLKFGSSLALVIPHPHLSGLSFFSFPSPPTNRGKRLLFLKPGTATGFFLLIEDHLVVGGFLSNIVGSLLYSLKDLEVTIVMIGFYVNRTQ